MYMNNIEFISKKNSAKINWRFNIKCKNTTNVQMENYYVIFHLGIIKMFNFALRGTKEKTWLELV